MYTYIYFNTYLISNEKLLRETVELIERNIKIWKIGNAHVQIEVMNALNDHYLHLSHYLFSNHTSAHNLKFKM